jgi:hypothetical protein
MKYLPMVVRSKSPLERGRSVFFLSPKNKKSF